MLVNNIVFFFNAYKTFFQTLMELFCSRRISTEHKIWLSRGFRGQRYTPVEFYKHVLPKETNGVAVYIK